MIVFGESRLRRDLSQLVEPYHSERNHQGLGNALIDGKAHRGDGQVVCDERLGGLLELSPCRLSRAGASLAG